jgi:endonuclease V-like protein UPF0215 family
LAQRLSHVAAFDDAPFAPEHRGNVLVVGAVFAGDRLDGVLSAKVRRDGANATRVLANLILASRFSRQLHAVLLQGIALAGFNVVDLHALHNAIGIPVLVVSRRAPNLGAIRRALLDHVPGGPRKWRLIEKAGPMERAAGLYVQRAGLGLQETEALLKNFAVHSTVPEPLRAAHLIAGGITLGESRHRV